MWVTKRSQKNNAPTNLGEFEPGLAVLPGALGGRGSGDVGGPALHGSRVRRRLRPRVRLDHPERVRRRPDLGRRRRRTGGRGGGGGGTHEYPLHRRLGRLGDLESRAALRDLKVSSRERFFGSWAAL